MSDVLGGVSDGHFRVLTDHVVVRFLVRQVKSRGSILVVEYRHLPDSLIASGSESLNDSRGAFEKI